MKTPIEYSELTPEKARAGCWVVGMPNASYHNYQGISNSGLGAICRSPAHYAYRGEWATSRAMEIGTAFHTALFEPKRYADEYVTVDVKDRKASEYREAAKIHGGDKVLTRAEADKVRVMVEAILANTAAADAVTEPGYCEISGFAECPKTGALLRVRYDCLSFNGHAVDLKKTQDARAWAFAKSVHSYGYHRQEAFYRYVFELIEGRALASFRFLAVEEQPPCANVLWELDELSVIQGTREVMAALDAYAECEATNNWPSYDEQSGVLSLPVYAFDDIDDGEVIA